MLLTRFNFFTFFYFLVLLLFAILPFNLSAYNYVINTFFVTVLWLLFPQKKIIKYGVIIFITLLFLLAFTFKSSNWYYIFFDLVIIVFLLQIINLKQNYQLTIHESNRFELMIIIWIIALITVSFFKDFYNIENGRFLGLTGGSNLTSSIFASFIIFILIKHKQYSLLSRQLILLIVTIIYGYILFLTKSRTFLFVIPFLLYNYSKLFGFYRVLFLLGIITFILSFINYNEILSKLRLGGEKNYSTITRLSIYITMFDEIKSSFFIIPHGFNADNIFLDARMNYNGEHSHTVHNDFLKYWYNYGLLFFIFIYFWYKKIKFRFDSYFEKGTVLLVFIVNALQNTLFSLYLLIPLLYIIMEMKRKEHLIVKL